MRKAEVLERYIEMVSQNTDIPNFIVKTEMADEIGVNPHNLSEKDIDKMIALYKEKYEGVRICDICGKHMRAGFCIEDGSEYYCSEECLQQEYTEEEFQEMYESGNGYYTEWDE